ncbi:hypothetical protein E4U15_000665 [Claviceps sp. LM218 group G6]|nr:hypothetical protein E4U15_000665 [Claviceps sp. LM218 group G6]
MMKTAKLEQDGEYDYGFLARATRPGASRKHVLHPQSSQAPPTEPSRDPKGDTMQQTAYSMGSSAATGNSNRWA